MDTTQKMLDLLFRRIPPERILRRLLDQLKHPVSYQPEAQNRQTFLRFAEAALSGYSEDEQALLYEKLKTLVEQTAEEAQVRPSVFLAPAAWGKEVLDVSGEEPFCKFSQVLRWRESYHLFGQDMLVCAYLAYCDIWRPSHRREFAWPATLKTNHSRLNQMLHTGIAENHCHLNGSTQSFALSWCALMNSPELTDQWPEEFALFLQSATIRGPEDNVLTTAERVQLAALIRSILFRALHRGDFFSRPCSDSGQKKRFCSREAFRQEYLCVFSPLAQLADTIRVLQSSYGMSVPLPDGSAAYLDYALEPDLFSAVKDSHYRILSGERRFLYLCFSACFHNAFSSFEEDLFYLYLLLKTAFRGELIQVNKQVGFQNFANYQNRKDSVWETGPYWWEAYRMALNAPMKTQSVTSLEARFGPSKTPEGNISRVRRYDLAERFAREPYQSVCAPKKYGLGPDVDTEEFLSAPHFYVLHFAKRPDMDPRKTAPFALQCRHERLRSDVKRQAIALAEAFDRSAYLCSRIRGIDSCANEVDCRPEVFATAFRFLRNFRLGEFRTPSALLRQPLSRLSQSYHAGEDFYDIPDGLRAIDEAIEFLEFRRGDRIGHALAMGVDPVLHYRAKSMEVVLPKQNRLDDLVWLLYRGRELNVPISRQQSDMMQQEAMQLLREIYGNAIRTNHWSTSLQEYYCSMKLRGDAPELYQSTVFCPSAFSGSQFDQRRCRMNDPRLGAYRGDQEIAGLYYYYHYGRQEKIEGAKPITVRITPEYLSLMRKMQDAMQVYVEQCGIVIECNPTSNVLIGTFGEYKNHPIFRFYNDGLEHDPERHRACPQLHVCINTDDLGVFDTSLEFEYALLFGALLEQTDENGNQKYKSSDILRYLQNIQAMGFQAVFPNMLH